MALERKGNSLPAEASRLPSSCVQMFAQGPPGKFIGLDEGSADLQVNIFTSSSSIFLAIFHFCLVFIFSFKKNELSSIFFHITNSVLSTAQQDLKAPRDCRV